QTMRRTKLPTLLTFVQVAVTLAVLTNAVAIVGIYQRRLDQETGIDTGRVLSVTVSPYDFASAGTGSDGIQSTVARDMEELRRIPGVVSVSHAPFVPLSGEGPPRRTRADRVDEALGVSHSLYVA